MPVQKCPMCELQKDVVISHLLPAALYKECSLPGGNPIVFNSKLVIESSRQMQSPLLCAECEEVLTKGGETWMLPLFAKRDGSFVFHDLLTSVPPVATVGNTRVYFAASNPRIDASKVIHFAMGVFWKAAVHSWRGGVIEALIQLGEHTESIRTYLRGESSFPGGMSLIVGVLPAPVKHLAISAPYQGSSPTVTNFLFYALGLEFSLLVGEAIPDDEKAGTISANPGRPILLTDFSPILRDIAADVMKEAHKARNVHKYLRKPE
jgi:hypothetical protein